MLDQIRQRAGQLKIGRALTWLLAALPLVLGYVSGTVVKVIKLIWAAFLEGFDAGVKL